MKKFLMFVLSLLLMLSCFPLSCAEERDTIASEPKYDASQEYVYTVLEDGTAKIIYCQCAEENILIPDTLDGIKVTSLGDGAFRICSLMKTVTIPDSVISVGINPFCLCENLTDIYVSPDHPYLATIDGVLFSKPDKCLICYPSKAQAESYSIPNGVLIIGDCAFYCCKALTSITIPDSVTSIGDSAFSQCRITSIAIPESVTSIGRRAFSGCSLESVVIPAGVTSIEDGTFNMCFSLESVTIPDTVISIGDYAFVYCSRLMDITIPDGVTRIGDYAFSRCNSLSSIIIPESVTYIGYNAFITEKGEKFFVLPSLVATVVRDSYAAEYCNENGIRYTYPDALDWLDR